MTQTIRLPELYQSGMMIQRDKDIHLWGTAAPGAVVTATFTKGAIEDPANTDAAGADPANADAAGADPAGTDAAGTNAADALVTGTATAGSDGHFTITLDPLAAAEGLTLTVKQDQPDTSPLILTDIAVGDIWIAAGQSNMEYFLKYDRDFETTRNEPANPQIRLYNVPQRAYEGHAGQWRSACGRWLRDGEPGYETQSAPAWRFAREIQPTLGVPVAILGCNWGGTSACNWVPEEVLAQAPLDYYLQEYDDEVRSADPAQIEADSRIAWAREESSEHYASFEPLMYGQDRDWQYDYMQAHADDVPLPMGPYNQYRPSGLYHTMLQTIIPFSVKGVLWYQGESDSAERAPLYDRLMTALIEDWRREWQDDLPFIMVQLAPFGVWLDCISDGYTTVRDMQQRVADTVPGVYLASIMDLGEYDDIHPKQKMEVGHRLALLAREHVYHEEGVASEPPRAVSAAFEADGRIVVTFDHADGLTLGDAPSDWDLYPDGTTHPAVQPVAVAIAGNQITLTPPLPMNTNRGHVDVALGWRDYGVIHIQNAAGLSARPFCMPIE